MVESAKRNVTDIRELNRSNDLLGDHVALREVWERDGYWFFHNVLDLDAIDRFRALYRDELARLGYCEPDDEHVCYNGKPLDDFPMRMEPLAKRQLWKTLMAEPEIKSFFRSLLGFDAFWLPISEYRATPPTPARRDDNRFEFIHQDAMYNAGIQFRICWVPLVTIDAEVGGIAVAEGMHHRGLLHRSEGLTVHPITLADIPPDRWRRANYQPGDVLLMDQFTPHSGLSNVSDRFRLSLDIRLSLEKDHHPVIGRLISYDEDSVTVRNEEGDHVFRLDDSTFCRNSAAHRVSRTEIWDHIHTDDEVIVASEGDLATVFRPVH